MKYLSQFVIIFKEPLESNIIIRTIEQVDHAEKPADVEFLEGGIGQDHVKFAVTAEKGSEIGAEFRFFGEKVIKL